MHKENVVVLCGTLTFKPEQIVGVVELQRIMRFKALEAVDFDMKIPVL